YVHILEGFLLPTLEEDGYTVEEVWFIQDNDPKHTAYHTRRWLQAQGLFWGRHNNNRGYRTWHLRAHSRFKFEQIGGQIVPEFEPN
ncbi:hypothetical protein BDV98DRAFT_517121, partial [Pterulicium gracile]